MSGKRAREKRRQSEMARNVGLLEPPRHVAMAIEATERRPVDPGEPKADLPLYEYEYCGWEDTEREDRLLGVESDDEHHITAKALERMQQLLLEAQQADAEATVAIESADENDEAEILALCHRSDDNMMRRLCDVEHLLGLVMQLRAP